MIPQNWKLESSQKGELLMAGISLCDLADKYGTPLFILNENLLAKNASLFLRDLKKNYPGTSEIHYPFKCNSVPGVVSILKQQGLKAEVMSEFELALAKKLGYKNEEIIVNGPCKTKNFLSRCFDVRLIIADSISELKDLASASEVYYKPINVLLRINPDYTPAGMNSGSSTGSRRGSVFGLDIKTGEVPVALEIIKNSHNLNFRGLHIHIGTGIRNPRDYFNAIVSLKSLVDDIHRRGFAIGVFDSGGGFASPNTRELTAKELLLYQVFKKFPLECKPSLFTTDDYLSSITRGIEKIFSGYPLPLLIIEPGRSVTSESQVLLLKVHRIKERKGAGKWIITDGGIGTNTMPAYYEYHEIFLCNDTRRKKEEKITISGPCCFSEDIVYKHKLMPKINEGEIIVVMDCGAYFNQWESNFGFMKAPVISVANGESGIIRRRETSGDMLRRDNVNEILLKEAENEILSY